MANDKEQNGGLSEQARKDLLLGALGLLAFVVLSLAMLLWLNPGARWQLVQSVVGFKAEAPLDIAVVHTNDTWGYTQPCG